MRSRLLIVLIPVIALLLLFFRLNSTGLFQVAEARNAACAREMLERKDLVVPTFNGILRTDKPVLSYWAIMAAYKTMGVSEGSARFFSAVCGLFTLLATFLFARRHFNMRTAWLSVLILLSSAHFIAQFRLATPDPYLIFFHVASLYCFWEGWTTGQFKWYAAMYLLWGAGLLAKGPVAVFIPALSILLFLVVKKNADRSTIVTLKPWYGLALVALVALPWYVLVGLQTNGDWLYGFLMTHNVGRFQKAVDQHGGPFILTPLFVLIGMLPFSVFFIRSFSYAWQAMKKNDTLLFVFIACISVLVFYCFSKTRLINYTAPAYPFFSLITAFYFNSLFEKKQAPLKTEIIILFFFALLLPVVLYIWLGKTDPFYPLQWESLLFIVVPAGVFMAWRYYPYQVQKAVASIAASFFLFAFLVNGLLLPALDQQTPLRKRQQLFDQGREVIAYHAFNDEFVFYAHQNIPVFTSTQAMQHWLQPGKKVLVISRGKDFNALDSVQSLQCLYKDKEAFSSQYAAFYIPK